MHLQATGHSQQSQMRRCQAGAYSSLAAWCRSLRRTTCCCSGARTAWQALARAKALHGASGFIRCVSISRSTSWLKPSSECCVWLDDEAIMRDVAAWNV